jgi:ABC-type multidrug transport system permease subunit
MEQLGFLCDDSANVADFLTGVTVPSERCIKPGYESSSLELPMQSANATCNPTSIVEWSQSTVSQNRSDFVESVAQEKSRHLPKSSQFTVPLSSQINTAVRRQYQILWGNRATSVIKQALTIVLSLVTGSLFYQAPNKSSGLFTKGGTLFISVICFGLMAMSEVTDSFSGRPVLAKHKDFALYHPATFCFAQITADVPIIAAQVTSFSLILYFLVGLEQTAGAHFTFWIVLFALSMCMTALFRMIGAAFQGFDDASKVSGFLVSALITYAGYMIPKKEMHPWFVWIYWINLFAYGFEALMANGMSPLSPLET